MNREDFLMLNNDIVYFYNGATTWNLKIILMKVFMVNFWE